MLTRLRNVFPINADCSFETGETPVQGGLSLTPRDLGDKMARGMFVGDYSLTPADFGEQMKEGDYSIDPAYERNMDRNTLWERQEIARRKLSSAKGKKAEL